MNKNSSSIAKFFVLLSFVCLLAGCSADVKGKPALTVDPPAEDGKGGQSFGGMTGNPETMMLGRWDKNKDGNISKDELPDGGLDGYDYDGDGTISNAELKKKIKEISAGGLKSLESNPDEGKEVIK